MNKNLNKIVPIFDNLNGYLQSMRRLGLNQCHYSSIVRKIQGDFQEEIDLFKQIFDESYTVIDENKYSYQQIQQLHKDLIYSKLKINDKEIIRSFDWDIVEYFGLASTSVGNEWNPIVKNGAIVLTLQAKKFKTLVYYFVEVGGFMVVIRLSERNV